MNAPSPSRLWTDEQLASAVKASTSWRGVMRALGLKPTSASEIRIVRRHVAPLKLDASHFRGKRLWSDTQLRQAITQCQSWQEVLSRCRQRTEQRTERMPRDRLCGSRQCRHRQGTAGRSFSG